MLPIDGGALLLVKSGALALLDGGALVVLNYATLLLVHSCAFLPIALLGKMCHRILIHSKIISQHWLDESAYFFVSKLNFIKN